MKLIFLNFDIPISNIQHYLPIIPAPYKYMHTEKINCMVTEKKKILPGDFKYVLKHYLTMTGCHFIADLFFNKFIFFAPPTAKTLVNFRQSQLVLFLELSLKYPESFLFQ